jgi:hypothetical protein
MKSKILSSLLILIFIVGFYKMHFFVRENQETIYTIVRNHNWVLILIFLVFIVIPLIFLRFLNSKQRKATKE